MHCEHMLLSARWVLPMTGPPLKDACVIIEGRAVKDVLFKDELGYRYPPQYVEKLNQNWHEYGNAVIMPGLINLHSHLDYASLRTFDVDSSLFAWIRSLVSKSSSWTPEQWKQSALFGAREAALSGTTCIADSSYSGMSARALAHVGLRGLVGLELFGWKDEESAAIWGHWLNKLNALKDVEDEGFREALEQGRITLTVSPHAPYTVCPTLWLKAATWAKEKDLPLLAHLSETREECAWIAGGNEVVDGHLAFVRALQEQRKGTAQSGDLKVDQSEFKWKGRGMSPVKHLKQYGLLDEHLLAAHCVHVDEQDIELLAAAKSRVAHCPRSNARLRCGAAPLKSMLEAGLRVGLGTDSMASCDDLSVLNEARFAFNLHRAIDPTFNLTSADLIAALTTDASRILNMDPIIGTLEQGKHADIAVFSIKPQDLATQENAYDLLLHGPTSVIDVFVDGRRIVENGALVNA